MHDQALEQQLRAALRAEGDGLPLTITAAELDRRLALRRRGGLSPMASLGLAAAVGLALLGLVGVAGGWFETRTAVVAPSPSPSSGIPSDEPSASPAVLLPAIDDIIANLDPATIVRAQAVGPADGPAPAAAAPTGPRMVRFAPIRTAGAYRVWTACRGDVGLDVVVAAHAVDERERIPISCDGSISVRQVGFEAGDTISLRSTTEVSWRVVVEAPARGALHAASIAVIERPVDDVLLEVGSETGTPDYGPTGTGGGVWVPAEVGQVAQRERYRVLVTCAGPHSIRYAFGRLFDQQNPPDPLPEDHSVTEVECDGGVHEDVLELPLLDGARLLVTSSPQEAWQIIVTSDKPPIALAPDADGWTMSSGFGPNFSPNGQQEGVTLVGPDGGGEVRVVISCAGDAMLTGTIDVGPVAGQELDSFTLDCSVDNPEGVTLARSCATAASSVTVTYDPHRATIWLAVSVQVRTPASPAP